MPVSQYGEGDAQHPPQLPSAPSDRVGHHCPRLLNLTTMSNKLKI